MDDSYVQPLETDLWLEEWHKLSERHAVLDGETPDASIRKAFFLTQMTPIALRPLMPVQVDETTLEQYLECGAYLSAAMALFGADTGMNLTRAPDSRSFSCSVRVAPDALEGLGRHEDPAKALLAGLCSAVLNLDLYRDCRPQMKPHNEPQQSGH